MRYWSRREILLGSVSLLLSACTQGQVGDVGYSVAVNGDENQVAITQEANATIVTIQSRSGIGQASSAWWGSTTPHPLYFLLHLNGLEQFSLRWADHVVNVSVNSTSQTVMQSTQTANSAETMITPDSPYWMDVTLPTQELSVFTVAAPAAFIAAAPNVWGISWVDTYR